MHSRAWARFARSGGSFSGSASNDASTFHQYSHPSRTPSEAPVSNPVSRANDRIGARSHAASSPTFLSTLSRLIRQFRQQQRLGNHFRHIDDRARWYATSPRQAQPHIV